MAADRGTESAAATLRTVPFFGPHQAGITTAAQDRMHVAAFDVNPSTTRAELIALFKDWTVAAARMPQGHGA
jgi:deferrochelatase/peroxidase EfeB